uniref:Histone-lysine N-methyltransferase MLL5 n=1 Tax=Lygus hesperus TaxID=30085 RepID=A0A0A9WS73_LYGHE
MTNPAGIKILVASTAVPQSTAIIEVRGKYMLSKSPSGPSLVPDRSGPPKWSPYVFHHKLGSPPEQTTEVCVDATTYGNDARFVRRSCRPNSELRHCIEKGVLHLYIVSTASIEAKGEILLPVKQGMYCACGLGEKCQAHSNKEILPNSNSKRTRGRRRTVSENSPVTTTTPKATVVQPPPPPPTPVAPPVAEAPAPSTPTSPVAPPPVSQTTIIINNNNNNNVVSKNSIVPKEKEVAPPPPPPPPPPAPVAPPVTAPSTKRGHPQSQPPPVSEPELSPPPPKVPKTVIESPTKEKETIVVAPPPAAKEKEKEASTTPSKVRGQTVSTRRATTPASKQEEKKRNAAPKDSPPQAATKKPETPNSGGKMTREERKMEAIMKAFERLEKDEQRKQQTPSASAPTGGRARKSSVSVSTPMSPVREKLEKPPQKKKSSKAVRETRSSKTLRSRRSNADRSGKSIFKPRSARSKGPQESRGPKSPPDSSSEDNDEDSEDERDEPPVATKARTRGRTNKKLSRDSESGGGESGGRRASSTSGGTTAVEDEESTPATPPSAPSPATSPHRLLDLQKTPPKLDQMTPTGVELTPPPAAVSNTCLLVAAAVGPLAAGFKFPKSKDPKKNLMSSWFGSDMNGPQSPPKGGVPLAPDFAKKRWLRQAISEDSDSPKNGPPPRGRRH